MANFADTFELPFIRKVGDKEYTVPLLTTSDYLEWIVELAEARKAEATRLLPTNMKPAERHNIERSISLMQCTPDDIRPLLFGGAGTIRVLQMAGKKAGIKDEAELKSFVDGRVHRRNVQDAFRASGLVSVEEYTDWFLPKSQTETPVPNASGPGENNAGQ